MLAINLRALRLHANYTMEILAETVGVSRQSIAKWESAESTPDIFNCQKLAKLYNVSLDALVNEPLDRLLKVPDEGEKCMFGVVTVDENGNIPLPEKACDVFGIKNGDMLLVVGDKSKGIAIVKCDGANSVLNIENRKDS